MTKTERAKLRAAFADYTWSEGCDCCQSSDHNEHRVVIAKLLGVPSKPNPPSKQRWYDFAPYRTKKKD